MKRLISFVLAIILIVSIPVPAHALKLTINDIYYTDPDTGNKLTLPAGWMTKKITDSLVKVEFTTSSDSSPLMQYGSADIWASLSSSEQKKTPRAKCDNSQLSKTDVAEIVGTKTSLVKMVTLNQREYFRAEVVKSRTVGGIKFTLTSTYWLRIENGWLYIYLFSGDESHTMYDKFEAMISGATYGEESPVPSGSDADIYKSAVSAYESGSYYKAEQLFSSVKNYKDSSKYLRLIRIRNAGSNFGVGSDVYLASCGLTESDKKDIDAAAKDFYFADTAEVLLCNSDVACYYLVGKWNGGSKCYIHFKMNKYGGTYNIGSKLSTNYKSTFSIDDGELRVDVLNTDKLTLHLTLTAPDCMEVYTYEKNCKTYTLKRK